MASCSIAAMAFSAAAEKNQDQKGRVWK